MIYVVVTTDAHRGWPISHVVYACENMRTACEVLMLPSTGTAQAVIV